MASSLRKSARDHLLAFVATQEASGDHIAVDVWRVLQEESKLLYETQLIRDLIDQDPFQCYKDADETLKHAVTQFQQSIQVSSCHRLEKDDDYCYHEAVVQYNHNNTPSSSSSAAAAETPLTKKQKRQPSPKETQDEFIQLHFRYERQPASNNQDNNATSAQTSTPTCIFYSIDMSQNHGPKENIVTIRCWAKGNKPSKLPAISIEADEGSDDDDWEDIDSEEEEMVGDNDVANINDKKSTSIGKNTGSSTQTPKQTEEEQKDNDNHQEEEEEEEEEAPDRYACFVDPDVLQTFQTYTQLTAMDQPSAFFTLMVFPFHQHEWDLVGFVLDSVFGYNEEEEEEGAEERRLTTVDG